MASYALSFTGNDFVTVNNLAGWQVLMLDPTDSWFANSAVGHLAFDVSGSDLNASNIVTLGVAWADCDVNKNNAIIGVTKYATIDMSTGTRRTGLNNSSGRYVYETITMTGSTNPIKTLGIGPMIDLRSSPKSGIVRRVLIGLTYSDALPYDAQLIITPTRIL